MATSSRLKPRKPTINDVARLSGVAKVTVSRVINDSELVRPETRRKVMTAIEELDYAPDKQARGLASKRSFLLGLVYDNPNALYISDIQKGILSVCRQAGYEMISHPAELSSTGLSAEIGQFVSDAQVDGLIFMSPISQSDALASRMKKDGVPYVRITPSKIDAITRSVISNDRRGAELMTEHLIANGHRRVGFVTGPRGNLSASQKLDGFEEVMRRHGQAVPRELVVEGDNTFVSGVTAGEILLRGKDRPTAIFASNDEMALGVMKTAALEGISVPGQLSVAGFDDSAVATFVWPDLTTVSQPLEQIGALAADKLLAQLNGGQTNVENVFEVVPEIVVRASTSSID